MSSAPNSTCHRNSQSATEPLPFRPQPYVFRIEATSHSPSQLVAMTPDECLRQQIRCPDFHILLDHTLAVLWMFYAKRATDPSRSPQLRALSVGQVQWAIRFLETIRSRDGAQSGDVSTALEHLQEMVFEKLAQAEGEEVAGVVENDEASECRENPKHTASLPNITSNLSAATEVLSSSSAGRKLGSMASTLNDVLGRWCPGSLVHFLSGGETSSTI